MIGRKGYKAMYSGKCLNQTYMPNTIYKMGTNIIDKNYDRNILPELYPIKLNVLGFHYSKNADDVVCYYDIKRTDFELYEVIDHNPNVLCDCDTSVTDELEIVRLVPRNEYSKVFAKSYFELVGMSRIYVWKNNSFANIDYMIKYIETIRSV